MIDGVEKWVLIISLGMAPAVGGFGTIYFVGSFDGTTFVPEGGHHLLDHGRDNYAGVSFYGLPDEERTVIGWMSNWVYARELPVIEEEPRRGAMTLARRLSLAEQDGVTVLRQQPVEPQTVVGGEVQDLRVSQPARLPLSIPECCRLDIEFDLGEADGISLRFRHAEDEEGGIVLGYERSTGEMRLDRSAVAAGFPSIFRAAQVLPTSGGRTATFSIWTDITSVEIFADGGLATLASLVDVAAGDGITVEGIGGEVVVSAAVAVPVL